MAVLGIFSISLVSIFWHALSDSNVSTTFHSDNGVYASARLRLTDGGTIRYQPTSASVAACPGFMHT